jgi:hypothetical protein
MTVLMHAGIETCMHVLPDSFPTSQNPQDTTAACSQKTEEKHCTSALQSLHGNLAVADAARQSLLLHTYYYFW